MGITLAIFTLIIIAIGYISFQYTKTVEKLTTTPYCNIDEKIAKRRIHGLEVGKVYDIFVSYKSENAETARIITEQLLANGLKVWLAEYRVLLETFDRSGFQKLIDQGIKRSKFGLCFINDLYFKSPHCGNEYLQLFDLKGRRDENIRVEEVFQFEIPSEKIIAQTYCPSIDSPTGKLDKIQTPPSITEINEILSFIEPELGIHLEKRRSPAVPSQERKHFRYFDLSYNLDLTGWELIEKSAPKNGENNVEKPKYHRWFGKDLIWGYLIVGPQDQPRKKVKKGISDDREYFDDTIIFAREFYKKMLKQKCIGVHLLFLGGYSQIAITTLFKGTWSRIYSIVLPHPKRNTSIEFAFYFFCREPFTHFCRHTIHMDKLVKSLKLE